MNHSATNKHTAPMADPDFWKGGVKMKWHHIVWFGNVKPKNKKKITKVTATACMLTIAAHPTNYAFITDKLHKNPYIRSLLHATLNTDCFIRVTALLEYFDLGILKVFGGTVKSPP